MVSACVSDIVPPISPRRTADGAIAPHSYGLILRAARTVILMPAG